MQKATVILGGGAALGFAHIGVLKAIEKQFEIIRIIGTSMGSLIGGLYAYGMTPDEILEFATDFKYIDFMNPFNIDLRFQGLFDGTFIEKKLNLRMQSVNIENLNIKYSAVAFDLNSKCTVIIDSGNCAKAMRASAAIPYIFNPATIGDYALVDGGVEYPLPCLDLEEDEFTIAVNVLPKTTNKMIHLDINMKHLDSKKKGSKKWHEIIMETINCNQSFLVQEMLKNFTPDIYLDCNVDSFLPADFFKAEEISKLGERIAEKTLREFAIEMAKPKKRQWYKFWG